MSKIHSEVIRVNDQLFAKLTIVGFDTNFKTTSIEIWKKEQQIDLIKTMSGYIKDNRVIITKKIKSLEIIIPYVNEEFECRIFCENENEILQSETIQIKLQALNEISTKKQSEVYVESEGMSFDEKIKNLPKHLSDYRSAWILKLSMSEDVVVNVLRESSVPTLACFGQNNYEVCNSDFIFTLRPGIKSFVIPIELVAKNTNLYKKNAILSVFELIKADFHNLPNVFYKSSISNGVSLENIVKVKDRDISYFTTPFGDPLGEGWTVKNNIPVKI